MKTWLLKSLFLLCLLPVCSSYASEDINHTLLDPYTHSGDFSWIAGQLKYVGLEGPTWYIVYQEDNSKKYLLLRGGYIYEPPKNFKDGDMVILQGTIKHMEMSSFMTGDYYDVSRIELLNQHNDAIKQQKALEQAKKQKEQKSKM